MAAPDFRVPAGAPTLRVMTWNIHGGVCPRGSYDLARVIALIRRHAPDVLALQEVEGRNRPGEQPFVALRDALGGHAADAVTMRGEAGGYGHMLITRFPLEDVSLHDLSAPGRESRTAIAAKVATPAGPLRVITAHLGLGWRERRAQAAAIAALARRHPDCPTVAMGDFNDWTPRGPVDRVLLGPLPSRSGTRTFPSWRPLLSLDRIYCRPRAVMLRAWTDKAAREASDHLPVIADLALVGGDATATTRLEVP
ncbi:endonuclease/exonuclease/phosphatase family protein [Roseomonas sp. CCTCC AB2023176]|uniref:endonuclease/exonuclease/phosphatase family protein n=1 Tax=Roseomonas sp. CCTCC AB2023176 TaxID=3342640 RepID=UPI0035D7665F